MDNLKIIVVDDNKTFRDTLVNFITKELKPNLVCGIGTSDDLLEINEKIYADIILINIALPIKYDFSLVKELLWNYPYTKIIGISLFYDDTYLAYMLEAGFKGCIDKNSVFEDIHNAIGYIMSNRYFFSKNIMNKSL